MKERLMLLFGGRSAEYEVSLLSVYNVSKALDREKYDVVMIGMTRDGVWYRIREYYYAARREGISRTDEEHYAGLVALAGGLPIDCVVVDPSAASFIACILSHRQFRVCKADNDVLTGIRQVSDVLMQGRLRFHVSCEDILREFTEYCWKENSPGDTPRKEHDHAMDDMRYFVTTAMHRTPEMQFAALSIRRTGGEM